MADKNVTQFTALAAAPAAADVIYIADLSEAVLDDQNKKITADNLFHFMEGGNYTGSIVLASGETITVASDTDAVSILGRVKIGYDGTNADIAVIGHFDFFTANAYALAQSNNGSTYLNAASGQGIEFRVNNSQVFGVNASGLIGNAGARITQFDTNLTANSATRGVTQAAVVAGIATPTISDFTSAQHDHADAAGGGNLGNVTTGNITSAAGVISMGANTDTEHILGKAKIGYDGTNAGQAVFSQYANMSSTNYGFKQIGTGATYVNAPTGQSVQFMINNSNIATVDASGLTIGTGVLLARADADTEHILGRAKVGYNGSNSDQACFAHYDNMSGTNYALRQTSAGATRINAASGQIINFLINNSGIANISASGLNIPVGSLVAREDEDIAHVLGRAKIGYNATDSDHACLAHYDHMSSTNYGFKQTPTGLTALNAPTGLSVDIRINNVQVLNINGSGWGHGSNGNRITQYDNDNTMAAASTSRGITQSAAKTYIDSKVSWVPDTDEVFSLGRVKIGYDGATADVAVFAHYDQMAAASFALSQNASGATILNAASGQGITFSVNDTAVFGINASGLIGGSGARITAFLDEDDMSSDSATAGVTQQSTKAYVDNRTRVITLEAFAPTAAVSTGDGKVAFVVPAELNGLDITAVICGVYDKGITGTTDVVIRRRRGGVDADVLSTAVTIGDEWYAADGVINTSNDDLATGDTITVDVDAIHSGTAPNGLTITLECS